MFAILAEDESDFVTLKTLTRRIARANAKVVGKGFRGASQLLKDGAKSIKALSAMPSVRHFIVCVDADELDGADRNSEVHEKVIAPSGVSKKYTIVVPTWELEAWILADVNAASKIFGKWERVDEVRHPENIREPKEHLVRLCRRCTAPKYNYATHNPKIAEHLDLQKIYDRCSSFRGFADAVMTGCGVQRLG